MAKIESGERAVRIDEAAVLADMFEVSVDALLGRGVESNLVYTLRAILNLARQSADQTFAIGDALMEACKDLDSLEFGGRAELQSVIARAVDALLDTRDVLNKVAEFRLPRGFKVTLRKDLLIPETRTVVVARKKER